MRFAPKVATALVVYVAYLVVFYGIWVLNDIQYEHIGDSASTILKWYVAPLAGGAAVLIVSITWLRWWRPVMFDAERHTPPRWMWLGPVVMVAIGVVFLVSKDYTGVSGQMVVYLILGSIGVGFCEEVVTRGVLLTGFRASMSELGVWFWTCLLFGLLHMPNWLFGLGPGALLQTVMAFMAGSGLYVMRRLTGSLFLPMAVHGFWDFAGFIGTTADGLSFLAPINAFLGLILGLILVLRERGLRIPVTADALRTADKAI